MFVEGSQEYAGLTLQDIFVPHSSNSEIFLG